MQIFSSLDEQLLRHLVEFLEEIAERSNTKDIFRKYDFRNGIEAAIMVSFTVSHVLIEW